MPSGARDRFDGPWKAGLTRWMPECLALFAPAVHDAIDWSRGFTLLDKELARIAPDSARGAGIVDTLISATLKTGPDALFLIHAEVQTQHDPNFARRMFSYHARLLDQRGLPVYSIAILGDSSLDWRPDGYHSRQFDCRLDFTFPIIKLLDYCDRSEALEADRNPFTSIVLGHLAALATKGDPASRYRTKLRLVRRLYHLGYSEQDVLESYRLLDWLLSLPKPAAERFHAEIVAYEEERRMPYISSAERIGIGKGRKEGRQEGRNEGRQEGRNEGRVLGKAETLAQALRIKLGGDAEALAAHVLTIEDAATMDRMLRLLLAGATVDALWQAASGEG